MPVAEFKVIAAVHDPNQVRVLVAALRAHGFHPLEDGEGLPGLPGAFGPRGLVVSVPVEEAGDAELLAQSLLRDMNAEP